LTNTFKIDVSYEAKGEFEGFGASFKASTGYSSMSQSMKDNNDVYVSSSAECVVYHASY